MAREDLITTRDLTEEERKAMAKRAGIKSGEARRKKKSMKELLNMLLNSKHMDQETVDKIRQVYPELSEKDVTNKVVLLNEQIKKASIGDTKAFEVVRDTSGEKPVDKVESINEDKINILTVNGEEVQELQ